MHRKSCRPKEIAGIKREGKTPTITTNILSILCFTYLAAHQLKEKQESCNIPSVATTSDITLASNSNGFLTYNSPPLAFRPSSSCQYSDAKSKKFFLPPWLLKSPPLPFYFPPLPHAPPLPNLPSPPLPFPTPFPPLPIPTLPSSTSFPPLAAPTPSAAPPTK